jgi:hypothetical protein
VNTDDLAKEPEPTFGCVEILKPSTQLIADHGTRFLADLIRRSIVRTKDPKTFPKLLAAATETFDKSIRNNSMIYPPPDSTVTLNNFVRYFFLLDMET